MHRERTDQRGGRGPSRTRHRPGAVLEVIPSRAADVAGSPVRRALPRRARRTIGAWCFLDHFRPVGADDPPGDDRSAPPHRAADGDLAARRRDRCTRDSLGSEQLIRPGQLNLMTAGRGVAHAEDGRGYGRAAARRAALGRAARRDPPRRGRVRTPRRSAAARRSAPATATVLVGELGGVRSRRRARTRRSSARTSRSTARSSSRCDPQFEYGFVVLDGSVDGRRRPAIEPGRARVPRSPVATSCASTADRSTRALLLGGEPFDEILMWWNFVARTRDEMDAAYRDWEADSDRFGVVRSTLARIGAPRRPGWLNDGEAPRLECSRPNRTRGRMVGIATEAPEHLTRPKTEPKERARASG